MNYLKDKLVDYALTGMSEHRGTGNVIKGLLKLVGDSFGIHHIAIVEKKDSITSFTITYEYCGRDCPAKLNHIMSFGEKEWMHDMMLFQQSSILYFASPDEAGTDSILYRVNRSTGGSFCATLLDYGIQKSMAMLIKYQDFHEFSEEEKECYVLLQRLISAYLLPMRDLERNTEELQKIRMFDSVTGLMKYEKFIDIAENIYKEDDSGAIYAVVYSDINNFKYVNEYYGYLTGDEILRQFEQFFLSKSPLHVIASRLFSDYFISMVRLNPFTTESMIVAMVDKMNRKFADRIGLMYSEAKVSIASGIAVVHDRNTSIITYIDRANIARKKIKKSTSCTCLLYDETMESEKRKEMEISSKAEEALFLGEFYFELQPKINLDTHKVIGAEALVRWRKSDGDKRRPDEFIPVFEKNGFITKLDFMVYNEVCKYLRERIKNGQTIVPISVNVSRVHFQRDDFADQVIQIVDNYGIPHQYLEFEITESVFIDQMDRARGEIRKLREAGFIVSMDDFGSGYSSLNLLKDLDFDVLKLDKDFLTNGNPEQKEAVIISSIIQMAKQMKITVLCEGVETKEQADFLSNASCDLVQGYLYGKPMQVHEFDELLSGELE